MSIRRIAAAIAIAALAPTPSFAALTLVVTGYNSPTNASGTNFQALGKNTTISLTPGVVSLVTLDSQLNVTTNGGPTLSGDGGSTITLGGISKAFSDSYTFTGLDFSTPEWLGGSPIVFSFATFDVTVTPVASSIFRRADFLETTTVPEPSSILEMAAATLAGLGMWARRRRAARIPR